jgi:hypothetical protein
MHPVSGKFADHPVHERDRMPGLCQLSFFRSSQFSSALGRQQFAFPGMSHNCKRE